MQKKEEARNKFGIEPQSYVISVVANLVNRKGHRYLLEAINQLRLSEHPIKVHALFAGDGDQREKLKQQCEREGLNEQIQFLGFTRDVESVLNASDVFVLPSSQEGLSIAVTEAMARGVPVISTNIAGLPEVVRHGVTGRLVPPESPEAIAVALRQSFEEKDRTIEMACAARVLMETEFEEDLCLRRCAAFLESCVVQK